MALQLRILIIILSIIALTVIINMIKKEKLDLKYSLSWIFAGIAILLMAVIPNIIERIADTLKIATPVNALFFIGICFILVILFSLTVAQSRNSRKMKELVQKVGLLEHELESNKVKQLDSNK